MLYLKKEQIEFGPLLQLNNSFNCDLCKSIKDIGLVCLLDVQFNPKTNKYRVISGNQRVKCLIELDQLIPCKLLKGVVK